MKRTTLAAGVGLGLAFAVLGGPAAMAGEQHHKALNPIVSGHKTSGHHPSCGGKCTPAPKPPAGGWPCQVTHSCKPPKVPHCRPPHHHHPKPPVKPPVTPPTHVTPKPPIHLPHVPSTPVRHDVPAVHTATPTATPQLAYTGATSDQLKVAGLGVGMLVGGTALVLLTSPLSAFNRKARTR
jgi:hypothetical protein